MNLITETKKVKSYDSLFYYMPLILLFSLMLILGTISLWLMSFSNTSTYWGDIYQNFRQSNNIIDYVTYPLGIGCLICLFIGTCVRLVDLTINYKSYSKKLFNKFPNFGLYAFLIILFFISGFIGLWLMSFTDTSTFLGGIYQTYKQSTGVFNNTMYPFITGLLICSLLSVCIEILQKLGQLKLFK